MIDAAPRIPPKKDLRQTWWRISDQGSTGSCVGWATADAVLRWHFVKTNRIAQNELLSPRFQWIAAKETDQFNTRPTTFVEAEGTSLKAALDVSRKFGSVKDTVLPFATGLPYRGSANTFYAIAAQLKISMYFNLGDELANWRLWLATKGPILTRLSVDSTWDKATANKGKLDVYARRRRTAATRSRSSATRRTRSSSGTAGARAGATRASRTPRSPTRRTPSPRPTGSSPEPSA